MRAMSVLAVLAGCYAPRIAPGSACELAVGCPGDLVCIDSVCQVPGTGIDASTDPGPDAPCTPACAGDVLACGASETACMLGCASDGTAHCRKLVPSNGATWQMAGMGTLTLAGSIRIDTGSGAIDDVTQAVAIRDAGTGEIAGVTFVVDGGIAIFGMRGMTVDAGATVRIEGEHPVVLLVDGDASIAGLVDASGGCVTNKACPGPGGGAGSTGSGAGGPGAGGDGGTASGGHGMGGGGGGFAQAGAIGAGEPAKAGATYGTESLVPLRGGSGGGRGGTSNGGRGGGGGGGLQITAAGSIHVTSTGAIDVGGGGGAGELMYNTGGGGGGGAGGAVLLEATSITVMGTVTANGGGGGGHTQSNAPGNGSDGLRSATPAPGAPDAWGGGNGGTGLIAPTSGRVVDDHGGGGGGGAGRIRFHARNSTVSGVISPAATVADVAAQ